LGHNKCNVQPDKRCKREKERGEILLHCRHQSRDGSIVAALEEKETSGYSTEDGFCKDNYYI